MKSKGFITLAILAGIGFVGSLLIEGPYASELTNGPFGDISAYVGIMKWICLAVMIVCIICAIVISVKRAVRRTARKVSSGITNKLTNALSEAITNAAAPDTTPQETKFKLRNTDKQTAAKPAEQEKPKSVGLTCAYCGSQLSSDAQNCPNCGAAVK